MTNGDKSEALICPECLLSRVVLGPESDTTVEDPGIECKRCDEELIPVEVVRGDTDGE